METDVLANGVERGVGVERTDAGFAVRFEFDREMVERLRRVDGVEFNAGQRKEDGAWHVPAAVEGALAKAVKDLRYLHDAIEKDRKEIFSLASASAVAAQKVEGREDVAPKVSEFHRPGTSSYGEIVNVNGRFVAQFTGFGKENGAAFVSVHRLSDLDNPMIMKGDDVKIAYDERGKGAVTARSTPQQSVAMGEKVDGVKIEEKDNQLAVSFDFNPPLEARLRRVDGVTFDKNANAFLVPAENRQFVLRAVGEMRKEFAAQQAEKATLGELAQGKVDNAVVRDAFTKDGQRFIGPMVGETECYMLQSIGQGQFKVHRREALAGDAPVVGHMLDVAYQKGRGTVTDSTLEKGRQKEAAKSR